jgi:hypothetical protein
VPPIPVPTVTPTTQPTTTTEAPEPVPTTVPATLPAPTVPAAVTSSPPTTVAAADGGVVITEGTVVEPSPDARTGAEAETATDSEDSNGWLTATATVRLVSGGLVALAVLVGVLTVLYWRHTRPGASGTARPASKRHGDETAGPGDVAEASDVDALPDGEVAPLAAESVLELPADRGPVTSGIVTVEDLQGPGSPERS